jgi:drug/metabolite transporter (DMT)-like permease
MPAVFVLVWSTGFVAARLGMPHAPPFGFLAWRFGLSVLCLLPWIMLSGARWPQGRRAWAHLAVTGLLMQAGYLGGVWAAVKAGMGAGLIALIVGLQPLLTAAWLQVRGVAEPAGPRTWVGLALGFAGVAMVVAPRLGQGGADALSGSLALVALLAITTGTLYQKRFVAPTDVRTASAIQLLAAFAAVLPLAMVETEPVRWHPELLTALSWSVLGLTLGGSSLLFLLIQRGAATRVTSLLYLVPPCTAVMAWAGFGEPLGAGTLAGLAAAAAGVALVSGWRPRTPGR